MPMEGTGTIQDNFGRSSQSVEPLPQMWSSGPPSIFCLRQHLLWPRKVPNRPA